MEHLFEYLLFLGKAVTVVAAILVVLSSVIAGAMRAREHSSSEHVEVKKINDRFDSMAEAIANRMLSAAELKARQKADKKEQKRKSKLKPDEQEKRRRLFVIDFDGDLRASAVDNLREEITAVLTTATKEDEILIRLESPGGVVHGYGLGASQLSRIRDRDIPLTVAVDKVAASGGYLMAVVANKIVAAPFAILGSIGVLLEMPNFNRFLKKHDIDFELLTAGEHKRSLTLFGENTDADREKATEELELTHKLFKDFVTEHRPQLDIAKVATGEHWQGQTALELNLVDELKTSDDILLDASKEADIYQVRFVPKQTIGYRITHSVQTALERFFLR